MTINDIAELAGVSVSTVSKIINGKDKGIKLETRERVLKIVKEYRYTPYDFIKNNTNDISMTLFSLFIRPSSHIPNAIVRDYFHLAQPKRDVHNRICGR
mgnify:CR=1 FL=1